jgi:hypothetical protein
MQGNERLGLLLDRIAALSGIVAVGLIVTYISIAEQDVYPDDPSTTIATVLADNRDTLKTAAYLGIAAAFVLLWFIGYLHGHLRRSDHPRRRNAARYGLGHHPEQPCATGDSASEPVRRPSLSRLTDRITHSGQEPNCCHFQR